jgi:hypothetical protein
MDDFDPDNLLKFDIEANGEDTFFVNAKKVGK